MAEAKEEESRPPRGKVQEVRKQWSVHEDGALAYQIQNQEITQHYGLNRFNRRTVREDIPIAKIVQSEEEIRQQEERMRQLQALKAQAEEDARVAEQINEQLLEEVASMEECRALDDEELARQLQEKEKQKYEKHLERKREKRLKKERQILEATLAKDSEEARLVLSQDSGSDQVTNSMECLNLQVNVTRVTPTGRIEDDGDFTDFYNLPDEMDEFTRMEIQASQDEELARLLQEQEHKRTKAEIDQEKLRKIEVQDEQLARIIQEQEKLRLKKAKQKHQSKKDAKRQVSIESLPLGASANTLNHQKPQPQPATNAVSAAVPINSTGNNTRYRRNSYTQAFDSPPSPPHSQPPQRLASDRPDQVHGQHRGLADQSVVSTSYSHTSQQYLKAQKMMSPPLSSSVSSPRSAYIGPGGGLSTLESARRIAAGDPERIMALQNSHNTVISTRGGSLQERHVTPRDASSNTMDIIRAHSHHGNTARSAAGVSDPRQTGRLAQTDASPLGQPQTAHDTPAGAELRDADATELLKWLTAHDSGSSTTNKLPANPKVQHQQRQSSRSGSGSCYTDEEEDIKTMKNKKWKESVLQEHGCKCHPDNPSSQRAPHHGSYSNGSAGFNIATAIDPTYQRRHPEVSFSEETHLKSHIPFSRSLPQTDGELEWDPGLRGSLRKTKAPIHGFQDSSTCGSFASVGTFGGEPVMSAWQPVQGQRRGDTRSRNKNKKQSSSEGEGKKDKGACKQQ